MERQKCYKMIWIPSLRWLKNSNLEALPAILNLTKSNNGKFRKAAIILSRGNLDSSLFIKWTTNPKSRPRSPIFWWQEWQNGCPGKHQDQWGASRFRWTDQIHDHQKWHLSRPWKRTFSHLQCVQKRSYRNMPKHVEEANHITGVSHSCDICGKTSRTRHGLRQHNEKDHRILSNVWNK